MKGDETLTHPILLDHLITYLCHPLKRLSLIVALLRVRHCIISLEKKRWLVLCAELCLSVYTFRYMFYFTSNSILAHLRYIQKFEQLGKQLVSQ